MSYFGVKKINENVHFAGGLPNITRQTYINMWTEAKNRNYTDFYQTLCDDFDVNIMKSKEELDKIALNTQIQIKKVSKMLYLHGFVLYAALRKYIKDHPDIHHINIVETGTAKGFSALCMAKAGQIQKGTMAAIVGIDDDMIESICSDYEGTGIVVAANYNSPGQVVISGSPDGVKWVVNIAKDLGGIK